MSAPTEPDSCLADKDIEGSLRRKRGLGLQAGDILVMYGLVAMLVWLCGILYGTGSL